MTIAAIPDVPASWRDGENWAAVLGSPIVHSLSPVLHQAAYDALGLPWSYLRHEVAAGQLANFMSGHESAVGFSVTMPLKEEALDWADRVSERAWRAGVANTLVRRPEGWYADNTDVVGIVEAVREAEPSPIGSVGVLGAGGTARAAALAADLLGATELVVAARSIDKAAELAELFGGRTTVVAWPEAERALGADVVVSTVPAGVNVGLAGHAPAQPGVLLDAVYSDWPNALALDWSGAGGVLVPGTIMLLHQAAAQIRLMAGIDAPIHRMREALKAAGAPT